MSNEKPIDQFLFELDNRYPNMTTTDDDSGSQTMFSANSFNGVKSDLGSFEKMMAILTGQEKFEYGLLDDKRMVRTLIDQIKNINDRKEELKKQNKTVNDQIKSLESNEHRSPEESEILDNLKSKYKTYQLQKRLTQFGTKIKDLDDILKDIEDGVNVGEKRMDKYDSIVGDLEDALFDETYVKRNLNSPKGEIGPKNIRPKAMNNFPIKYISDTGITYFGIVRPPSGIITWEGSEARQAWLADEDIKSLFRSFENSKRFSRNDILKIRLNSDYTVAKEQINDALLSMRAKTSIRKITVKDDSSTILAVKDYIFNGMENTGLHPGRADKLPGIETRSKSLGSFMDKMKDTTSDKEISVGIDKRTAYSKGVIEVIDTVEFWRFIRSLF